MMERGRLLLVFGVGLMLGVWGANASGTLGGILWLVGLFAAGLGMAYVKRGIEISCTQDSGEEGGDAN